MFWLKLLNSSIFSWVSLTFFFQRTPELFSSQQLTFTSARGKLGQLGKEKHQPTSLSKEEEAAERYSQCQRGPCETPSVCGYICNPNKGSFIRLGLRQQEPFNSWALWLSWHGFLILTEIHNEMKETQVEWCNTEGSLLSFKTCYYYGGSFPPSAQFLHFPADPEETKTHGLPNLNVMEFDHI